MIHNFINIDKWNALSPTYKSIIKTASMAAHEWMQAKYDAANPAALKRLVAAGTQLRPFPPSVMDACLKASLELYNEVSATNADFKKAWGDPESGIVFCLSEAPSKEAVMRTHERAGHPTDEVYEITATA